MSEELSDEEAADFVRRHLLAFARQEWMLQDLKDEMADRARSGLPIDLWASVFKGPHSVSDGEWSPLTGDGVRFRVVATGNVRGSLCTLEAGLWWYPSDARPRGFPCVMYAGWARLPEPLEPLTFFMGPLLRRLIIIPSAWLPWTNEDSTYLHAPIERSLELTDTYRRLFSAVADSTDAWLDDHEVARD